MVSTEWIKNPNGYLKIIGLAVSIVSFGLFLNLHGFFWLSSNNHRFLIATVPVTTYGFFYLLIMYALDNNYGKSIWTEVLFDIVHGALNLVAAGLIFDNLPSIDSETKTKMIIYGALMIGLSIVMFIDAFFAFKKRG